MKYPESTKLWVKCEDHLWWPAKVIRPFEERGAGIDGDTCVEFYHNLGELYVVDSHAAHDAQPFHVAYTERTPTERSCFAQPAVQLAVERALGEPGPSHGAAPAPLVPRAEPFSAAELRSIQALLKAVDPATNAALAAQMEREGIFVSNGRIQRRSAAEQQARKRARTSQSGARLRSLHSNSQDEPEPSASTSIVTTATSFAESFCRPATETRSPSPRASWPTRDTPPATPSPPPPPPPSGEFPATAPATMSTSPAVTRAEDGTHNFTADYVAPAEEDTLEVLRHEVFEMGSKFVLSPVYKFIDVIGAVSVSNRRVCTSFPSPHATRERSAAGFAPSRRVLLVPLSETLDHRHGWMLPLQVEQETVAMTVSVNGTDVPLPHNWHVPAGKEEAAVKVAPVVDVTHLVLHEEDHIFTVHVHIPDLADMELWSGLVVCIFADEVPVADLAADLAGRYRKPMAPKPNRHASRGLINVTEGYVRVSCPLTSLPMDVPARGVHCEHLQCMELMTILTTCVRSNVWNCPICFATMRPSEIWVNYRLKEWICTHRADLARVDYVIETAPEKPLKVLYSARRKRETEEIFDVDA